MNAAQLREHLYSHEPQSGFPWWVVRQVWKLVERGLTDKAVRRTSVEWITIDGPTTLDADDAVWCEYDKKTKLHRVYVSITDITEAIPPYTPMDLEALVRSTTLYLHPTIIPMLPEVISNDIYSLNGKRRHIALTVEFDIDPQGNIVHSNVYESNLKVYKTYTYDVFNEDAKNLEATHYSQIQWLFSVVSLLNNNRWMNIGAQGLRETNSNSSPSEQGGVNVHTMIATLMVMANQIIAWKLIEDSGFAVFRQHLHKQERAFYTPQVGKHEWLWIYPPNGYTHFTSPLRRYADMLVHRVLKAKMRKEEAPYSADHLRIILDHINKRILEVEIILGERKWQQVVERIRKRNGWEIWAHDLKVHIQKWARDAYYTIPQAIRQWIINDIRNEKSSTWQFAVWIILLCNDYELKAILFESITKERKMSALAFLNAISQTRIAIWDGRVFDFWESVNANNCIASMRLPDWKILTSQKITWKSWRVKDIRWIIRKSLMFKIFRYYMK